MGGVPEASKVKELFTNPFGDQVPHRDPDVKVSNLVSEPKLNMKYDDAWYL